MKRVLCALVFAGLLSASAEATPILTFGQVGSGTPISGTNLGFGTTTITGLNVPVSVTGIAAINPVPFLASFSLGAVSTSPAVVGPGGQGAIQNYSGTFCITSLNNCGGTNYLSGVFTDIALGAGASLILAAAQPPDLVNFTSSVIPAALLLDPSALAFSFAGVVPPVGIFNGSLASFSASVSGTFSASEVVPEPGTLALLGMGLAFAANRFRMKKGRQ